MEKRKLLRTVALSAGALAALWVFISLLLPLVLPFLLALGLAAVTEPAAALLRKKTRLGQGAAGTLCMLGAYILLAGALFLLGKTLFAELADLLKKLPQAAALVVDRLGQLRDRLTELAQTLPPGLSAGLESLAADFFRNGAGVLDAFPEKLLRLFTGTVRALPNVFLFTVTTVVASFLTAASLPRLRRGLSRILPPAWRRDVTELWSRLKATLGGWIKAELKLGFLTFVMASLGLFLLRQPYPLLFGLLVAVVDLLPVLGAGTVLLPWGLSFFLRGQPGLGTAFALLYGVISVTRTTLEPRFLGQQIGLPPLLTLAAVYIGYRLAGLWGLLLFPLAVSTAVQVAGRIKKSDGGSRPSFSG